MRLFLCHNINDIVNIFNNRFIFRGCIFRIDKYFQFRSENDV